MAPLVGAITVAIVCFIMMMGLFGLTPDLCFKVLNEVGPISVENGSVVNLYIGKNSSIHLSCSQLPDQQGIYTVVYGADCSAAPMFDDSSGHTDIKSSPNIEMVDCGHNCRAYNITPLKRECLIVKCSLGTTDPNLRHCVIFVNIVEPPAVADIKNITSSNKLSVGATAAIIISVIVVIILFVVCIIILFVVFIKTRYKHCFTGDEKQIDNTHNQSRSSKRSDLTVSIESTTEKLSNASEEMALPKTATRKQREPRHQLNRNSEELDTCHKKHEDKRLTDNQKVHQNILGGDTEDVDSEEKHNHQETETGQHSLSTEMIYIHPQTGENCVAPPDRGCLSRLQKTYRTEKEQLKQYLSDV